MKQFSLAHLKEAFTYLDRWIDTNRQQSGIPAIQIAVQYKNRIVYSRAFGVSNLRTKEPLTTRHLFRIASHSKTFTATAIMQLVEQGKIGLDDHISRHLSWFKSRKDRRIATVTIRQLLNNTSGIIRDGTDSNFWQLVRPFPELEELKSYIQEAELFYHPDERFKYSNFGFGILGQLIREVSGLSYREYTDRYIIKPLRLKNTGADLDPPARKRLATGYSPEFFRAARHPYPHVGTAALDSATGFYSNAEDVCRYLASHFFGNQVLLKDASKRHMQHGYWETGERGNSYGLGMTTYHSTSPEMIGHGGGFPGYITNSRFDPSRQLAISVLTNASDAPTGSIGDQILKIIDKFQEHAPESNARSKRLHRFAGRFCSERWIIDIIAVGERLLAINPLSWSDFSHAEELKVVNQTVLKIEKADGYSSPGELVHYTFNKSGKVSQINLAGMIMLPESRARQKGWKTARAAKPQK